MNAQKLAWIRSQIGVVSNFGDLNTPNWVANPIPQSTIAKPIVLSEAMTAMTAQEAYAVAESRTYDRILNAINQGRLDWVVDNLTVLYGASIISTNTMQALSQLMAQTIVIDNPAQIFTTPAELAGFSPVTLQEWEEANAI